MKRLAPLGLLVVLSSGCSALGSDGNTNADGGTGLDDAPPGCSLTLTVDPPFPTASPVSPIRIKANLIGAPGVVTYMWTVVHNGAVTYTYEAPDHSQIGFLAPTTGTYAISVQVDPAPFGCDRKDIPLNVGDPNANNGIVRLRTVPSPTLAPPQETVIQIQGGGDYVRDITLDQGLPLSGLVHTQGGPGVPAYVKLIPIAAPNAFTETFTSSGGAFSARLLGQTHDVLVIPTSTALAPKKLSWAPAGSTDFIVGAGTTVTGVVRNPAGNGFGGAKVQLEAGGVPSTVGTTAADGSFSLHADLPSGAPITVQVTPSPATGLPRLEATGAFDLNQSVQVTYSSALATCDLGGNAVKRAGANQAGAKVMIVGTLSGVAGTISTGTPINATGTVHAPAIANGSGVLPSTLVPRSDQLSAVISLSATDWAVDPVDTSACAAASIDALPLTIATGVARNAATTLAGVKIEATPTGALAAGDAEPIVVTTAAGGAFSIGLAANGTYDVRFFDPLARAAPLALPNIAPAGVPATATLPKSLVISGKVSVTGTVNPVVGASVQILCSSCGGIDSTRPISQTATDTASSYRIAVPDPGVM